jgi:hypothetical protein
MQISDFVRISSFIRKKAFTSNIQNFVVNTFSDFKPVKIFQNRTYKMKFWSICDNTGTS